MMTTQLYPQKGIIQARRILFAQKLSVVKFLFVSLAFLIASKSYSQTITAVSGNKASYCKGSTGTIYFTVKNGIGSANHFTSSTNYIVYISNGGGFTPLYNFTSTTVPVGDGGTAQIIKSVTVPINATTGNAYRISVGSVGPNFDGSTGANASGDFSINANPTATYTKVFASPCNGGTDGSITVTPSGGKSPYLYSWTGVNGFKADTPAISGLALGDYTVIIKDNNQCADTILGITIKQATPVQAGIDQKTNPGCSFNDGTIVAFRIGGVYDGITPIQFKIDGNSYQASGIFNGLSAGNHTVTVKDSKGCTGSTNVTLTQAAPMSFTPNGYNTNVSACGGGSDGSITVTVSGGVPPYHYMLDGVDKEVSSLLTYTIRGLQPNNSYNVSVTDSKGCSISKNVMLMQEPAPTAIVNYKGTPICMGGNQGFLTIGQTGGIPGFNYSDDGGTTFQGSYRFLNLSAGIYSIVVRDSKGCTSAPVAVTIADGTGSCMSGGRIGNVTNIGAEDRGSTKNGSSNLSKIMLNSSLIINTYPNPFASGFTLDVNGNNQDKILITVTDVLGRRMYQEEGNANQQYKLGSNFKNGLYIVQVTQGSNIQTIKIVKE